MKYFIITLALFLISGCSWTRESPNYIGTVPTYASKAPHPVNCGCCSYITMLRIENGDIQEEWYLPAREFEPSLLGLR